MPHWLIGVGSNLGPREETLRRAIDRFSREPGVEVVAWSRFHATRPIGGPAGQAEFLNAAAILRTGLAPEPLLDLLLKVEQEFGRQPGERWAARPLDLDLLLGEGQAIDTPRLKVPHPRMAWRRFVLEPAVEIAPQWVHPPTGWSLAHLLEHLRTARRYLAFAGSIAAGKTELAQATAARSGASAVLEAVDAERLAGFYADPAGKAWQTEIEFLRERTERLAAADPAWSDRQGWAVSDFWFDQSMAFAEVWLAPGRREEFRRRWLAARPAVVRPKLIVLLEAPAEVLHERMLSRARPYERSVRARELARIQDSIVAATAWPDQGPVLRLGAGPLEAMLQEVLAAMEAME